MQLKTALFPKWDLRAFCLFSVYLFLFLIVSEFEVRTDALRSVESLIQTQAHNSCLLV